MGVTVQIGNETRDFNDASETWIDDQIVRRQRDRSPVCVVTIKTAAADVFLATPMCSGRGGGGTRSPNQREQQIFALWNEHKLDSADFTRGSLVAFLKQLRKLI
jgi:hypothetical protein